MKESHHLSPLRAQLKGIKKEYNVKSSIESGGQGMWYVVAENKVR